MTTLRIGPIVDDAILSMPGRGVAETVSSVLAAHEAALRNHVDAVIRAALTARVTTIARSRRSFGHGAALPLPGIVLSSDLHITTSVAIVDDPPPAIVAPIAPAVVITDSTLIADLRDSDAHPTYPCTFPGCVRGPANPYDDPIALSSHRSAAHGIRSTNAASIARQARRDKARVRQIEADTGQRAVVTPGEREFIRRRATFVVPGLARELRLPESLIVRTLGEVYAANLAPQQHYAMPSVARRVHDQAPAPSIALGRGKRQRKPA